MGYLQFDASPLRFYGTAAGWLLLHQPETASLCSVKVVLRSRQEAPCRLLRRLSCNVLLALIASTILLALNVAAGGGSVILARRLQSRLDIAAASSSLSSLCANGSDTVSAMRRQVKGFSSWSRPMLPDHADLAATEQAQRDISAAPLRRYRRFHRCPDSVSDTLTGQADLEAVVPFNASRSRGAGGTGTGAARGDAGDVWREAHPFSIPKPQCRSTVAPFMQPALSASFAVRLAASSLSLSLSSNATGFDQDDAAGLAVERTFDYHLLEKRMLLEAAACKCTLQMQPSALPVYPRACRQRSICSSGVACHPHACCACP